MVTQVADLDQRTLTLYHGNYDSFLEQKNENYEKLIKAAALQQKKIEHLESFVERFRAKATKAKQAQSRMRALEKIERIELPQHKARSVSFSFPQPPRSGQEVVRLAKVRKAYGDHLIYENVDLRIERGERVALVGPNGAGKSTLLKVLADETGFQGERLLGYNVSTAFFAQHQVEALDLRATVLQVMERAATAENIARVRGLLGAFLFSGDAVQKPVSVLSGGEKSRLALARMMLNPANFLLLDEPTNHLDIASCDVLEDALQAFEGTICFVSHDRHFINGVATRVIHVEHGRLEDYPGDYEYYQWKRAQQAEEAAAASAPASTDADPMSADGRKERKRKEAELRKEKAAAMGSLKKDLAKVEEEIAKKEQEKAEVSQKLADPALYNQGAKAQEALKRHATLERELETHYARWEELSVKIEEVEAQFAT
jgi:ATP-binding cassette subfamily F protein 3